MQKKRGQICRNGRNGAKEATIVQKSAKNGENLGRFVQKKCGGVSKVQQNGARKGKICTRAGSNRANVGESG